MSMGVIVVMIVVAMLVVMMVITVMMVTAIMRRMVVRGMIVTGMGMRGFRRVGVAGIGAAFGIERRLDLDDARAEALHHRLDHVIPADAKALRHDLGRQVAIAEMPSDPDQMQGIGAADFEQRLGGRHHLDEPSVFQHQRIAAAQRDGVFQIEQEFQPARARHRHPPPVPIVEIEHDGIGRGLRPAMLAQDFGRADHVEAPGARSGIGATSFETALRASLG